MYDNFDRYSGSEDLKTLTSFESIIVFRICYLVIKI